MNEVTLDQLMTWRPCISRGAILTLTAGRDRLTLPEICDLAAASAEERLWVLLRPEVIDETILQELACQFASRALNREREAGREPHPALWTALHAKRAWLLGEITHDELQTAARSAAAAYADAAADYADAAAAAYAYAARSATAAAAARSAARSAASDAAARSAARSAASAAAYAYAADNGVASYDYAYAEERIAQLWVIREALLALESEGGGE